MAFRTEQFLRLGYGSLSCGRGCGVYSTANLNSTYFHHVSAILLAAPLPQPPGSLPVTAEPPSPPGATGVLRADPPLVGYVQLFPAEPVDRTIQNENSDYSSWL